MSKNNQKKIFEKKSTQFHLEILAQSPYLDFKLLSKERIFSLSFFSLKEFCKFIYVKICFFYFFTKESSLKKNLLVASKTKKKWLQFLKHRIFFNGDVKIII